MPTPSTAPRPPLRHHPSWRQEIVESMGLVIMVMAVGINGVANYSLMFGKWGMPALGVAGTGWASTLTYWSMAIALLSYILLHPAFRPYQLLRTLHRFRWSQFRAIAFLMLPRLIISAYLDMSAPENQAVITTTVALLAVGGMFQLVDGIQVIAAGALRGLQDTAVPMAIGLVAYWGGGFTIGYFAAFRWGWGGVGLWSGLATGLAIAAVTFTIRFHLLCNRQRPI